MLRSIESISEKKVEIKEEKEVSEDPKELPDLKLLTLNIACLPSKLGIQINGSFLKSNKLRANAIADQIIELTKSKDCPDFISFQEAFDGKTRKLLLKKLSPYFPYNTGELGEKCFNGGSGLLLFSKYRFLESKFIPYYNTMLGEETLANKGFIAAKIELTSNYFITVYNTHLQAGGGIGKEKQSVLGGTTSFRRGEELGKIRDDCERWSHVPPKNFLHLRHAKTICTGDFNVPQNNERQRMSISTGMSDNGFRRGSIKYPGQNSFFTFFKGITPKNFIDVRVLPETKGRKKIDPALMEKAIKRNLFTGSSISQTRLKENKDTGKPITPQDAEYNIIDGMYASYEGKECGFESELISFENLTDHFGIIGRCKFN